MEGARVGVGRRWGALLAGCALALAVAANRAGAGEPEPVLENLRFAFANRLVPNAWTPFIATIGNPGNRAVDVRLVLRVDMGPDRVNYLRRVRLPAHSRRHVNGFARFDYPPMPLRHIFEPPARIAEVRRADGSTRAIEVRRPKTFALDARLFDVAGDGGLGGRELSRLDVVAIPTHPDGYLLAVHDLGVEERRAWQYQWNGLPAALGEYPENDVAALGFLLPTRENAFDRRLLPEPEALGQRPEAAFIPNAADFPAKWAAYEGIDALWLGRLRAPERGEGFSPVQRHGLEAYIHSGGKLVVLPALDPDSYRHPFWDRLLPVRLGALRPITDELAALAAALPGADEAPPHGGDEPAHMIEATPGEGEVLAEHDGMVLWARRRIGAGEVWFFAGSGGALTEWNHAGDFVARMLAPAPAALPGLRREGLADNADAFLAEVVGLGAPPRGAMLGMLGMFFVLAVVALAVARRRGRQEIAWPVIIGAALTVAAAAWVLAARQRRATGILQGEIGFMTLSSGATTGTVDSLDGLYAGGARDVDIVWTDPDTLATLQPEFARFEVAGATGQRLDVEEDLRFVYPRLRMNVGELTLHRAKTLATVAGGVVLEATLGPDGLEGFIENRGDLVLEDGLLRGSRGSYAVGTLAPGQRVEIAGLAFSPAPLGTAGFLNDEQRRRRQWLAEALRLDFNGREDVPRHYVWPLTFTAWHRGVRAEVRPEGDVLETARGHQLLAVTAQPRLAAGNVRIPPGLCGLKLVGYAPAGDIGGLYGNRARPHPGREAPAPGEKPKAPEPVPMPPVMPPGMEGMERLWNQEARAAARAPDYSRRHEPTGWLSGREAPPPFRCRFTLPPAAVAAGFAARKLTILADIDVAGLEEQWRVRRVGHGRMQEGWAPLPRPARAGGADAREPARRVIEGGELAALLGPAGELPEIEIWLRGEMGQSGEAAGAQTSWTIRMLDVEVEGDAP